MSVHLTTTAPNRFADAGMLAQVALIRDYGPAIATAVEVLECDGCPWIGFAADHASALDQRLAHEAAHRPAALAAR